VIRTCHVIADVVKLGDRNLVQKTEMRGAIERLVDAAVVPVAHLVGVLGINPQRMMVAVHASAHVVSRKDAAETRSAIVAHGDRSRAYTRDRDWSDRLPGVQSKRAGR